MIEVNPLVYVNALFVLMISSIVAFIFIIHKLKDSSNTSSSLRYFNLYFTLGVLNWIGYWAAEHSLINLELRYSLVTYVLTTMALLWAIAQCSISKWSAKIFIFVHALVIGCSFFLKDDNQRALLVTIYELAIYPIATYLAFKLALSKKNIGYGLIGLATLIKLCAAPVQLYAVLVLSDVSLAFEVSLFASSNGFMLIGIGFLTSMLVNEHSKLTLLSLEDPLTGIFNRRGLEMTLRLPLLTAQREQGFMSAIAIDIDHFKKINDTYGHDGGDHVLKEFAQILTMQARAGDVCCRLGGEEFVIILPASGSDNAVKIAERIRQSVETMELSYLGKVIKFTSSFGVSTQCGEIKLDYLIKEADKALYRAKAEGRNRVCISHADSNDVPESSTLAE